MLGPALIPGIITYTVVVDQLLVDPERFNGHWFRLCISLLHESQMHTVETAILISSFEELRGIPVLF